MKSEMSRLNIHLNMRLLNLLIQIRIIEFLQSLHMETIIVISHLSLVNCKEFRYDVLSIFELRVILFKSKLDVYIVVLVLS